MSGKSPYLSREELVALTDRQFAGKQIDWLQRNAWKFAVSATGRPKVSREYHDQRLGTMTQEASDLDQEPDFSHWMK